MSLPSEEEYEISASELSESLAEVRLIDCRELDEFALCKIEGAELIPLSQFGEQAMPKLQDESKPIVVY